MQSRVRQRELLGFVNAVAIQEQIEVERARRIAHGAHAAESLLELLQARSKASASSEVCSSATALMKSGPIASSGALRYSDEQEPS